MHCIVIHTSDLFSKHLIWPCLLQLSASISHLQSINFLHQNTSIAVVQNQFSLPCWTRTHTALVTPSAQPTERDKMFCYRQSTGRVEGKLEGSIVFCAFRVNCDTFLIYVFQLKGAAAKFGIWPDIRISQGDKETLVLNSSRQSYTHGLRTYTHPLITHTGTHSENIGNGQQISKNVCS